MNTPFCIKEVNTSEELSPLEIIAKEEINSIDIQKLDKPLLSDIENQDVKLSNDTYENKISIICRNESLEDQQHPITGVEFEKKIIIHNGQQIEGVFPKFEHDVSVKLPTDLYEASNREQFDYANNQLKEEVKNNPELSSKFTEEQLEQIENGDRPDGFVWHHSENPGELQLVNKETHDKTGHTGGQVVWGGGNDNR